VTIPQISLESLKDISVLPRGAHIAILQKCIVALDSQGHESGVILLLEMQDELNNLTEQFFKIEWIETVDEELRAAHEDLYESVEDSAKALGLLLLPKVTPYTAVRQAIRGTHVDYYLVNADDALPLQSQAAASVEFTGILKDIDEIEHRIKVKRKRLTSNQIYPIYIVCVEHSFPLARIEKVQI
jgi:hypothetical protein